MGAGVCVLASDIPENREIVEGAGFTFRRADTGDLARMLKLLIASPQARRAAAERALARIREQYLWSQVTDQIDCTYRKLAPPSMNVREIPAVGKPAALIGRRKPAA
jgi:glycosyltransferase involved in cell wall biosynthesis